MRAPEMGRAVMCLSLPVTPKGERPGLARERRAVVDTNGHPMPATNRRPVALERWVVMPRSVPAAELGERPRAELVARPEPALAWSVVFAPAGAADAFPADTTCRPTPATNRSRRRLEGRDAARADTSSRPMLSTSQGEGVAQSCSNEHALKPALSVPGEE